MLTSMRRVLPLTIGLLLLGVVVWVAGPYFAFADYRPLESAVARLVLIALLVMAVIGWVLLKRYRANRASDQLVSAVVAQSKVEQPSAEVTQLRERFEEAVAALKQKRRGGQSLYDLPWYVFIGAPGSGKTTALVNSGLHFPLEQRSGRGGLRGIGGTRNCDWWFTDEAVFLDTAGRYTTQDSDAAADSEAWAEFLALLKKYRKRRPLNGVILTVSASDLLQSDGIEGNVEAARRRLDELNRELKIQLPVYLMVTKSDLVAGFAEYFEDLTQEGRSQVWGVTFPYEQTVKGEAAAQCGPQFDRLIVRLNERLFARIEEDREVARRTKVFAFPQQMAVLRDQLIDFIQGVFGSTRFDRLVLLRGVYFTSGTQEGTPIDRLLGALGRRFGAAEAVAPGGRGKAYFIERLLKDVLFAESGLAGVNRRFEVQTAAAQLAAYVALGVLTLTGIVAWSVSYNRNRTHVDEVAAAVVPLASIPAVAPGGALDEALPRLEALRAVVAVADRHQGSVPWGMRWGLYQGRSLGVSARDAYTRELAGVLLPQVAARFKLRLGQYASEPEKLYEYLKGYLMLGDPSHLNKEHLTYLADLEWADSYAGDPERAQQVGRHFRSMLDNGDTVRPMAIDESLVAQARSTLRQASLGELVYRYVRIEYSNDASRAVRLDVAAGLGADRVLRRRSGSLADPVPSIYTKPVFEEIVAKGTDVLVLQFTNEFWVWGDARPSLSASARLGADFLERYETDYIAAWDRILADIEATPTGSIAETKEALAILGGATSPLRGLLRTVDDNTYLVRPAEAPAPGLAGSLGRRLEGVLTSGRQRLGVTTVTPGARITAHFEPIHRLVAGDAGSAPIDGVLQGIQRLQQRLLPIGEAVGATSPGDPASIAAVGQSANDLRRDAAPLPPSIAAVVTSAANGAAAAVRGGVRNSVESRYQQDVARECRLIVADRYPFFRASRSDVPLADFGRLFGYGGIYDTFFRSELVALVDTARTPWAWRRDETGAAVGGATDILRRFEAAQRIREMYFRPGSQDPELRFTITPEELDAGAQRFTLDIDGQVVDYRHSAPRPVPITWPGPRPGVATATFEERGGGRPNLVLDGPWAWLRFMDAVRVERVSEVRFSLTTAAGGHQARVMLEAPSIRNPYGRRDLEQFRCE